MENSSDRRTIPVWCHICQTEGVGNKNLETEEYNCSVCSSECVEELSQGIELFNHPVPPPPPELVTSSPASSRLNQIQQPPQQPDTIASALQSGGTITHIATNSSGRPIGVIIRHITATTDGNNNIMSSSTTMGSSQSRGQRGLLGLLNSIGLSDDSSSEDAVMSRIMHYILMNERSHAGAPAATEETLNLLHKHTVTDSDSIASLGECNISQETFEVGDVVVCLPCEHKYKEENIVQWLKMHNTCPVCRVEVNLTQSTPTPTSTTNTEDSNEPLPTSE